MHTESIGLEPTEVLGFESEADLELALEGLMQERSGQEIFISNSDF